MITKTQREKTNNNGNYKMLCYRREDRAMPL